jgi:hypothetical protein
VRHETPENSNEKPASMPENGDFKSCMEILQKQGYHNYSDVDQPEVKKYLPATHVVDPTDFDDEYEVVTLTYYSDGVLTDENDEKIDDPSSLVGEGYEKQLLFSCDVCLKNLLR